MLSLLQVLACAPRSPAAVSTLGLPSGSSDCTCQWLDTPTVVRGSFRSQCTGVVQCRHRTLNTFVPQVRKITCSSWGDDCEPSACFTQAGGPGTATSTR